jgi:hypothetical protein
MYGGLKAKEKGVKLPEMVKLPQISGIEEVIGRAVETARPIIFNFIGTIRNQDTMAGMSYCSYIMRHAVRRGAEVIVLVGGTEGATALAPAEEIMRTAYIAEGKPEGFKITNLRYLSDSEFSHQIGIIGQITREKPAAVFYTSTLSAILPIAENAYLNGAIQIGGTSGVSWITFYVATMDYVFIGEEYFAGASYVAENPVELGCIFGADVGKFIILAILVAGAILNAVGVRILLTFLGG